MDLDRLKSVWQAQEAPATTLSEGEQMKSLLQRLETLEATVRRRDVREYVAACVVIAIFGYYAASTHEPLVRLGSLIVVFGSMFTIVWSRRAAGPARRSVDTGDLPIAQFCARELERIEAQIRLLRSVWWWYLGPTVVGLLLMLVPNAGPVWLKAATALFVIAVAAAIYWMNVTAARTALEPLRDELAARLAELRS